MTLAQEYKDLVDALFKNPCDEAFDRLEEFKQKNMISHGMLEGCGWSCDTKIFKDASICGWSSLYKQQTEFFTCFQ